MLPRKNWRTASVAPLSAIASLSLSTWRISVCAEPASSLTRSSKVNISALMRSADSRFCSSSAVMKRVSVWRSKLLKISAITSCASRRRVCDRFDMNSVRSVCSSRSITSFCTASIFSMRVDDVERELLGQDREHARGMLRADLREHDRDGLRVFVLEVVREHLLLHVGELLPHVAAGRPADLLHDAGDALGRQVLLQQPLGRVEVAEQRAGGRQPADEFEHQASTASASTVPSVDITTESSRSSSSSSSFQILLAVLFAERQHQHGGALRAGSWRLPGPLAGLAAREGRDEIGDLAASGLFCCGCWPWIRPARPAATGG